MLHLNKGVNVVIVLLIAVLIFSCNEGGRREEGKEEITDTHDKKENPVGIINNPDNRSPNNTPISLNIYIHETNSMKGFSFWGSQFGDDIHAFFTNLGDPQNKLVTEINSFSLSTKKSVEINSLGNGINALPDQIEQAKNVDGVNGQVFKGLNKDYSKILDKVIEGSLAKPNSVSAFVSDFVYHPGDAEGKDLNAFLKGQSQRMRATIQTALSKNPDLCMVLLRGLSDYRWNKKTTRNRPYYTIFLGKKTNLKEHMKQILKSKT
jgi:hypothetical protein